MLLPEQLGFTTTYFDLPGLRMHTADTLSLMAYR